MYRYAMNQFAVYSEIPLPCTAVTPNMPQSKKVLSVRHCHTAPVEFEEISYLSRRYFGILRVYNLSDAILLSCGDTIKISIHRNGHDVTVYAPETQLEEAGLYVINLVASICTLFQGDLPLHGAGVQLQNKFIGIMAPSGTGKSTLLWALLKEGGALFGNDDVIPLQFYSDSIYAHPSVSLHSKVRKPTLDTYLQKRWIVWDACQKIAAEADEYWVEIQREQRVIDPQPLSALFVLQPHQQPIITDKVSIRRQNLSTSRKLLAANTQSLWAVHRLLTKEDLLVQYTALAKAVPLYTISYPRRFDILPQLTRAIQQVLTQQDEHTEAVA